MAFFAVCLSTIILISSLFGKCTLKTKYFSTLSPLFYLAIIIFVTFHKTDNVEIPNVIWLPFFIFMLTPITSSLDLILYLFGKKRRDNEFKTIQKVNNEIIENDMIKKPQDYN